MRTCSILEGPLLFDGFSDLSNGKTSEGATLQVLSSHKNKTVCQGLNITGTGTKRCRFVKVGFETLTVMVFSKFIPMDLCACQRVALMCPVLPLYCLPMLL